MIADQGFRKFWTFWPQMCRQCNWVAIRCGPNIPTLATTKSAFYQICSATRTARPIYPQQPLEEGLLRGQPLKYKKSRPAAINSYTIFKEGRIRCRIGAARRQLAQVTMASASRSQYFGHRWLLQDLDLINRILTIGKEYSQLVSASRSQYFDSCTWTSKTSI